MKKFITILPIVFVFGILVGVGTVTITNAALKGSALFRDVPAGHFADDAIGKMVEAGMFTGLNATTFAPNDPLTRAQAALLFQRFIDLTGVKIRGATSSSSTSSSSVSSSSSASSVSSSSSSSSSSLGAAECSPGGCVHFGAKEYNVDKNDARGLVDIIVARIYGNTGAGTVDYTINEGTAVADKDYKPITGTLSFASKETSKKLQVTILNNTADVVSPYVTMKLRNPTGAIKIDADTATLKINDTRVVTAPTSAADTVVTTPATKVGFSASEYGIMENKVTLTINVMRTGDTTGTTEVTYGTSDGTAKSGSEYGSVSGKLTFNAGESLKSFTVTVNDNNSVDGSRIFNLNLSAPTNGAALLQASSTVTIIDNEAIVFGSGSTKFGATSYSVIRSDGKAVITVKHSAGLIPFNVNFATSNGSAVAGVDYTATSGTLQFATGEVAKTFEVPIAKDRPVSSELTVNVSISSPTAGVTLGDPASTSIKIGN